MPQSFIACDREQAFLMPPDIRDWLPEGHLAWFVLDAVAAMDLTAFYAAYREDGRSRPAYEPSMMVALLLYAYARGVRSARAIERSCEVEFPRFGGHGVSRRRRSPLSRSSQSVGGDFSRTGSARASRAWSAGGGG